MSIVFLGNGLNRLNKNCLSWNELLSKIAQEYGVSPRDYSSMTLGYEYFEETVLKKQKTDPKEIKKKIAELTAVSEVAGVERNLLKMLFSAGIKEFITTNYDYAIELTADKGFVPAQTTRETLYSRYRTQHAKDISVHHIHGECAYPSSICLGYEQYAGTLEKSRTLLTRSTSSQGTQNKFALYDVLEGYTEPDGSWLYKFFTEDIYFLGFGLDLSEMDIWWLTTYRAQLMTKNKANIKNRIIYYETGSANTKEKKDRIEEKKELLETFNVDFVQFNEGKYSQRDTAAIQNIIEIENKKSIPNFSQ